MMNSSLTPVDFDHPNNKLRRELECSICFNIFEDPRQLACGHVFCGDCVVPLIERVNADETKMIVKCPLCRREAEVPPDGQLPMAIVVKNLIEHFKEGSFYMEGNASENKEAAATTAINSSDTSRKARDDYLAMVLSPAALMTSQPEPSGFYNNNRNPNECTETGNLRDTSRKARDDYLAMVLSPAALVTSQPERSGFYNKEAAITAINSDTSRKARDDYLAMVLSSPAALMTSQPEPSGFYNNNNTRNPNECTETGGDLRPLYGEEETCCSDCDCSLCDDPECANLLCACFVECLCRLFCLALVEGCNNDNN